MGNANPVTNSMYKEDIFSNRNDEFELLLKQLAEKELELSTLEKELSTFEGKYARTVGILFAELDKIEGEIAKELLRINPKEEYMHGFQRAEKKARASRDAVDEKIAQADKKPFKPSDEVKNLFRKVAKVIHPDLAIDPQEREYRTILMSRANEAYKNGDMEALQQILEEWEHKDETAFPKQAKLHPADLLEQKIQQVRSRIKEIETRITDLKKSELYLLMFKVEQAELAGRDLLDEMAKDLKNQIVAARKLLLSLQERE
jgi:hypothetical protein